MSQTALPSLADSGIGGTRMTIRLKADERRERLLRAARKLFTKNGYEATRMDEIAEAAECTTGPLYHFFKTKRDIFEAVLRQSIEGVRAQAIEQRSISSGKTPLQRLHQSCDQILDLLSIPETQMFIREAPHVLGEDLWRRMRDSLMLRTLEIDLRDAMIAGEISPEPPGPLAALLWAAMIEAVNHARTGSKAQVASFRVALHRMIERLRYAPDAGT